MPQYGEFVYGGGLYGAQVEGYRIYLKKSTPPVVGVDSPLITTTDLVIASDVTLASLPTVANSEYFGLVTAYNAFGESEALAHFEFRTDATNRPMLVPSPVRNLRATALAGGRIRLEWDYWEVNASSVVADGFHVYGSLSPIALIAPDEIEPFLEISEVVPHLQPARHYVREYETAGFVVESEQLVYFRVLSQRAGKFEPHVTDVIVLADSLAPEAVPLGMVAA